MYKSFMKIDDVASKWKECVFDLPEPEVLPELLRFFQLQKVVTLGMHDDCFKHTYYDHNCEQEKDQKYQDIEKFAVLPQLV